MSGPEFEKPRHRAAARAVEARYPGVKARVFGIWESGHMGDHEATIVNVCPAPTGELSDLFYPTTIRIVIPEDGTLPAEMLPFLDRFVASIGGPMRRT